MRRIFYEMAILACLLLFPHVLYADKEPSFIPQDVIDGYVDRAFYLLNAAGDPASGLSQAQAVDSAKAIAKRLRNIAATDANQKYILWRTGELEGQIYLEEKGLLEEREQYRQKGINDLIPRYNTALGKPRPDFKNLYRILAQMQTLDPQGTAIDMENSIRKRAYALSREIPALLETNLDKGDISAAREDLDYCKLNAEHLGLSPARYAALSAKVAARTTAADDRTTLANALDRFKAALGSNNLAAARREHQLAGDKVRTLRTRMIRYEWTRFNQDYELFSSKLSRKEDSLAGVAVDLLKTKGPSSASDFLDTMRVLGVSGERIAHLDRMILETVVEQKRREAARAPQVALDEDDGDGFVLGDLLGEARKRSAARKDSLAAARVRRGAMTQVEEVRRQRLRVASNLREMREKALRKTDRQVALEELVAIYTSIELEKPKEARERFEKSKEFLKANIPAEDFTRVEAAISPK